MQTFLILISFILNIAALLAIVILYTRQNRLVELEKRQEKAVKEMEDVISSYLLEMKEDNDRFLQQFQAVKEGKLDRSQEKVEKIKQAAENAVMVENRESEKKTEDAPFNTASYKRQSAVKAYKHEAGDASTTDTQQSRPQTPISKEESTYKQILNLQQKGYTLEDIAKELGKGVTEVELLLKFRQNKK
ncbi:DUF6115 domain-containing protein [Bacillus sp. SCS-153A]|uniref:DUF6115 domain-containing protein n=1 Tax=Rossellomorea sedimentorum TaxID=3115294 RepID=UPI003905C148